MERQVMIRIADLDRFRLVGDEDCGVGLDCRDCDRGGKPIAYYGGITPAYPGDAEVVQCDSISGLLIAAHEHRRLTHA
jgi:hypothetical protein